MTQWSNDFHTRRVALFPTLPDPAPLTYKHTFTRTLPSSAGNQTFYYVQGSKCGNAAPGSVIVLADGQSTTPRRRSARH